MEVIEIPGYSEEEKVGIAKRYLIPRQLDEHGISLQHLKISDAALHQLISHYTREAGVRNLEREIATIMRKVAKRVAQGRVRRHTVTPDNLATYVGVPKCLPEQERETDEVGIATGLAWTESGGEVLYVEVSVMKGKGQLTLTGHLGDVMKESAQAALSYIRAEAKTLGINQEVFYKKDVHIHVPAGAIPKDGPSAGITMATALASSLTNLPTRRDLAMTGEITLRGRVLPVGGLKEKILAAKRAKLACVILPKRNQKDLEDIPKHLLRGLTFVFADTMADVIKSAIRPKTKARPKSMKMNGEPIIRQRKRHALPRIPVSTQQRGTRTRSKLPQ